MNAIKIAFVTQDDPFYVRIFFEEFLRIYPQPGQIRAVIIAPAMGKKSFAALVRQMYDFYGTVNFVRVGVRYVLHRILSRLPGWLCAGRFFSVEQVCAHYGVPVVHAQDINGAGFLDELRTWSLDMLVSVAAPQVFRKDLIGIPRLGCINIHNSKLPKYRGMLPNFWQMFNGERTVGTTIHRINAGIDDGEILLQTETPIEKGESLHMLICRTKRLGAGLMVDMLNRLQAGPVETKANLAEEATYFTFPTRSDVAEFHRRGYRLL